MVNTLVFPDGIRLANLDELPLREPELSKVWERIESANITAGYIVTDTDNHQFSHYAEANVDGPQIWGVFRELCEKLIGRRALLLVGEKDEELVPAGMGNTLEILDILEPHSYQLAHDGWIQFGLIDQNQSKVTEVLVTPTKHFRVWFSDLEVFRAIMHTHSVTEMESLEFIDEYPHTTSRLPDDRISFRDHGQLIQHFKKILSSGRLIT